MAAPEAVLTHLRIGSTFAGRYQILELLGAGGTSSVYKVRDELAGETIALKVIKPVAAQDPRLLANFKRELALARKISHPNVIRIYDIGEHEGLLYIVMELVDGRTLAGVAAHIGRLTLEEFLPIARQVCQALECVHAANIVHRDVKPANLVLRPDGAVKLMDFGIARYMSDEMTAGPMFGTPAYMSPEQLMRRALTPASDVYALGAMCYELLSGRKPFEDQSLAQRCTAQP
ncbi:MAG: serine/threonine-protein kinase, partial [Bryobacteraceae bacterium]